MAQKDIVKVLIHWRRIWHVWGKTLGIYGNTLTWVWEQNDIWGLAHMHNNLEWHTNWPKLMQLWHKIILIPSRIAICKRGFSKQNAIKSHLCNRLNLKTLNTLLRVSLCGLEVNAMDWATIFNVWRNMRDRRYLRSTDSSFVTNQNFVLIIQNIV